MRRIELGSAFLSTVPRVIFDAAIYKGSSVDKTPYRGSAVLFNDIRTSFGLSSREFSRAHLPETIRAVGRLFSRFDDLVDNSENSTEILTIKQAYQDEIARTYNEQIVNSITSTDVSEQTKQEMFDLIEGEVHLQYDLHSKYESSKTPLSSSDAFSWRKQAAGSLATLAPKLIATQLDIHGPMADESIDASYWYGAIFQLTDDIGDIGIDLSRGTQSSFSSCLHEEPQELEQLRSLLMSTSSPSYKDIKRVAPRSIGQMMTFWRVWYGRVSNDRIYPILHTLFNPENAEFTTNIWVRANKKANIIRGITTKPSLHS